MKYKGPDRRREPRFPIETAVNVKRQATGEALPAKSVNLSGEGLLLKLEQPAELNLGEDVTCEMKATDDAGNPLPSWGAGNVVRIDKGQAAIKLQAGAFEPEPESESKKQ